MFKGMDGMSEGEANFHFDNMFGKAGLVDKQLYYPGMQRIYDGSKKSCDTGLQEIGKMLSKAPSIDTTSGGTYTAYGLQPAFVDTTIVDRTIRETPLVKLLPRRASRSLKYVYNVITAKKGAVFLLDDGSLSEQVDTRTTSYVDMKYLYGVGRITNPALAGANASYINLFGEDVRVKMASMNEALEDEIINGDDSTDAAGFDGLIASITTNTTDNSGAEITLDLLREDFNTSFEANGLIDLVITDGRTLNYVKGLMQDYLRFYGQIPANMDFGIPDAFYFDGALFIKDRYAPTTAASRRIFYVDTRYIFLAVLQDMTYQEMGVQSDSRRYFIKWYGSLVINFESAMVMRYGLA